MTERLPGKMAWVAVHTPGMPRRYELNLGRRTLGAPTQTLALVEHGGDRWSVERQEGQGRAAVTVALIGGVSREMAQGIAEEYARKSGASGLVAADAGWRKRGPTLKQRRRLAKWGIELPPGSTAGEASDLINEYIARRQHRKATT